MTRGIPAIAAVLLLGGTVVAAPDPPQGKGKKHAKQQHTRADRDGGGATVGVHVVFGTGEVAILRDHYRPRYRNLPPGLEKKVARGGQLPPGWQEKLEPLPVAVERRLPPLPDHHRRGVIDGHAVIYDTRTHVILDVAVLF